MQRGVRRILMSVLLAFVVAIPIQAHVFNHEDRHEVCQADLAPGHALDDGHTHWHHVDATDGHFHGGQWFEPGHTHSAVRHDPCTQTGMDRPLWSDAGPLSPVAIDDAITGAVGPNVITDFDAFLADVTDMAPLRNLILVGDNMLDAYAAAGGMSGSGTQEDPYILEGHFIRNALIIKDTSKCIVVRDNIVHSRALLGPLFDLNDVVYLPAIVDDVDAAIEQTGSDLAIAREQGLGDEIDRLEALLDVQQEEREEVVEKAAAGSYEVLGVVSETAEQLVYDVADTLRNQLNNLAGRMILDWNGQCIHVYNNVVEDLRVNQNNARLGYATGGLIEDNRLFHIGQIRHYDGEFRDNVVGYKEHLEGWLPEGSNAPIQSWVAMNTDGFNQGYFHDNLFFGAVDLDFHGHHHGAGFFAPESHYHGSQRNQAYMVSPDGTCMATHADVSDGHNHGHHGMTGDPLLDLSLTMDHAEECLPHHNHQLRWTSAAFTDNIVIDPYGYGIRYEDRNHAGDDRYANSEDMHELDAPHFHRSNIRIADNVVLGSLWVDIFNSPTVDVWSDDFSEVRRDITGMVLDAVNHLGAEVLPSHPERNNGWLEIKDNVVFLYDKPANTRGFHYGWAAYQMNHIFEADALDFEANGAYLVPGIITTDASVDDIVTTLEAARDMTPEQAHAVATSLGEARDERPINYGIVVHHLQESALGVCDNAALGFDVSLLAWNGIYDDSTVDVCETNQFDAPTHIRMTSVPEGREPGITAPLRGLTEDTSLEPLGNYVATAAEREEDKVRAQQDWIERWSEIQMANIDRQVAYQQWNADRQVDNQQRNADRQIDNQERNLDRQLETVNRFMATQAGWADRSINNQLYWAEYQAAARESWAEWQLVYAGSQADYRAAQVMAYEDWALTMAARYTHAVPL